MTKKVKRDPYLEGIQRRTAAHTVIRDKPAKVSDAIRQSGWTGEYYAGRATDELTKMIDARIARAVRMLSERMDGITAPSLALKRSLEKFAKELVKEDRNEHEKE